MKGITGRDCRQFVFFWTLSCLLVFVLIAISVHTMSVSFPSLDDAFIDFIASLPSAQYLFRHADRLSRRPERIGVKP